MSEQQPEAAVAAPVEEKEEQPAKQEEEVKENGTSDVEVAQEAPKDMRAVVLTGFGGIKNVKILKKPEPTIAEGELLIRVKAW